MKLISIAVALSLLLSPLSALAEPKVYIRSNGQFVGNGNEYPRGFWIPTIRDADEVFKANPAALEQYRKHQDAGKWFGILNWSAVGAFATYMIISTANDNYDGGAGLAIFALPWGAGLIYGAKSNRHLIKAMNLMNGVPADQAHRSMLPMDLARLSSPKTLHVPLVAWSF